VPGIHALIVPPVPPEGIRAHTDPPFGKTLKLRDAS
jgi:hypothetical protein